MATKIWVGGTVSATNDWATAANWSPSGVPVAADDVLIYNYNGTVYDIDTGLNQSAVTLASLRIDKSYTGKIGTATAYLQVGCNGTVDIGLPPANGAPAGSTRIKLNFGSTTATVNVYDSASTTADTGHPPVRLLGSAITSVNVSGGNVGVATDPSETSTVTTLRVTDGDGDVTPDVFVGSGATVTNSFASAGSVYDLSNATTSVIETANNVVYTRQGSGAVTTAKVDGGTYRHNGTGTITTLTISGKADFKLDSRSKTVTTTNLRDGGTILLDNGKPGSITLTNGIAVPAGTSLSDVTISAPKNTTSTVTFS